MSKSVNIGQPLFNNIEGHPFILGPQGPYSTKEEARRALISFYENINDIPNGQECIIAGVRFVWRDNDLYENLAVKVINENNTDLNSYSTPGTYRFSSIRNNNFANLPINNNNPNASITGELVVYNSIEGTTTYRSIIGQVLFLSNAEGNETKIYTRSAKKTSNNGGATYEVTWGDWQVCQGMKEVGVVNSYDSFIDNGMYSGVYNNNGMIETFIVITINDYVVKSQLGVSKSVSQLKYTLNAFNNESKLSVRVGEGQEFKWSEWKLYFDEENITAQIINLQNQLNSLSNTKADKTEVEKKLIELKEETKEEINNINPIIINGNITNIPDEEDLTTGDDNKLKFKDRSSLDGMGCVILRKNFVEGKNTLTQDMINQENTIYEIRYNFDLNGKEITIPENSVLKFEGGNIHNGKLILNKTKLEGEIKIDTEVNGSIINTIIDPIWFGLTANNENLGTQNVNAINRSVILGSNSNSKVIIYNGIYYVDVQTYKDGWDTDVIPTINLPSNTFLDLGNSVIRVNTNSYSRFVLFGIKDGAENVILTGGKIIGDLLTHTGTTGEHGHGIYISHSKNVSISDIDIEDFWGDGINIGKNWNDISSIKCCDTVTIRNVKSRYNRRQGISIICGYNIIIENCEFSHTGEHGATLPAAGIDIEPNGSTEPIKNLLIRNCNVFDNALKNLSSGVGRNIAFWTPNDCLANQIENVVIDGLISLNTNKDGYVTLNHNAVIKNSIVDGLSIQSKSDSKITITNCVSSKIGYNSDADFLVNDSIFTHNDDTTGIAQCNNNGSFAKGEHSQIFHHCCFEMISSKLTGDWNGNSITNNVYFIGCTIKAKAGYKLTGVYASSANYINCQVEGLQLGMYNELGNPYVDIGTNMSTKYNGNVRYNAGMISVNREEDEPIIYISDKKGFQRLSALIARNQSKPSTPLIGELFYNRNEDKYEYWNGSSWKPMA